MTAVEVDRLLEAGEALLDARKPEQALSRVAEALTADPDSAAAHALAARALRDLGRHPEAEVEARQAVACAPQWAYPLRILALTLSKAPGATPWRSDESVAVAREAMRLEPQNPASYIVLADACATAGQFDEADETVRRGLQLAPHSAPMWVTASFVALKTHHWPAAESAARRALAIDPDDAAAINNLGVAIRRQGKTELGAVAFLDAVKIDPRSPAARENVELVGFQRLSVFAAVVLLPLAVFWPLYLAARLGTARWLATKPERLRPVARRLGIRVATSPRTRRRFERHNARLQAQVPVDAPVGEWSALRGRQLVSTSFLVVLAIGMGLTGVLLALATFGAPNVGTSVVLAVIGFVLLVGTGAVVRRLRRRRRLVY